MSGTFRLHVSRLATADSFIYTLFTIHITLLLLAECFKLAVFFSRFILPFYPFLKWLKSYVCIRATQIHRYCEIYRAIALDQTESNQTEQVILFA